MSIRPQTYQERRRRLMASLPENTVAVFRTGSLCTRNNDCDYEFRPDSSFFYLCGFGEPDALLFIQADGHATLGVLPKDPERELWDGFRHGVEGAKATFGVDEAFELTEVDERALTLLDGVENVALLMHDKGLREQLWQWRDQLYRQKRQGKLPPDNFLDATDTLHEMRLIKDEEEIAIMEAAAQISVKAHEQAMRSVRPGQKEYQLEAELNYVFMQQGARHLAYNNIVATGANACVLHYISNDATIADGDLILIDAGCELGCYASDITRTFPANGKFSEPQAALYQLVLDAQYASIEKMRVGEPYEAFHNAAIETLTAGLVRLGLLQGDVAELIENKAYREFYMHNTGHWLGLDVHDCGRYKENSQSRTLQPGMVLTVEPGLYVAADNERVDPKWRGIGIRIEDDILIREDGPYVLTHGLAKEIADIEALMSQHN